MAACPVDVVEADLEIDASTLRQSGIMGSAIVRGRTTLILDTFELADTAWPGWNGERKPAHETCALPGTYQMRTRSSGLR